jgi:hypothetical protein
MFKPCGGALLLPSAVAGRVANVAAATNINEVISIFVKPLLEYILYIMVSMPMRSFQMRRDLSAILVRDVITELF